MSKIIALSAGVPRPRTTSSTLPHVLLVVDQFPKSLGGGERVVLKLASELPQYGFRVSILTFYVHPECTALGSPPCAVYVLPLVRTYDLNAFGAAFTFRRFLRIQEVSIVQTFFESSDIWAGFVTKVMSRAKLIWSRRDMGILRFRKHDVSYRLMAKAPDAVFAVSDQVRRHCIEIDKIDSARVYTIYNGLDLSDNAIVAKPFKVSGKLCVTTVGNIRRVKGHDIFIRAAATIVTQFPGTLFSIAGEVLDREYFRELQALVHDLELEDNFHFVGGVADTRKFLADADIFVLPSRSEGFSNAIIEAMAACLPVIATDVGGNAEAVLDGVTGVVIPSEDHAALAAAIARLLLDPAKAAEMGAAGRTRASQLFTTEAMMEHVVCIYKKLLA